MKSYTVSLPLLLTNHKMAFIIGSVLAITINLAAAQSGCDIELSTDYWDGTATSWGADTGTVITSCRSVSDCWIETKQTFTRPIVVEAEMMANSGPECLSMNLFATDHGKNTKYSFETGGWQNKIRLFPGDYQETVGYNNDEWDTVRIELTDDMVHFYLNGVLKYSVADSSQTSGTLQFVAGCTTMKVRNPKIVSGADCAIEPTLSPTKVPSKAPTVQPTTCNANDMHSVNWDDLLNEDGQDTALLKSSSVDFDASTLSLTFSATVEYVGKSADGNFNDENNLGTSYWMGFESFTTFEDGMESAGSCANRRADDYADLSFDEFWKYTADPADLESATNAERMAYPPSDWALTATDCNEVVYERTLSWTELTACSDSAGNAVIAVEESTESVVLSGTFFVELVSPYSSVDSGYYRTFPLLQQDFGIALSRQVNVLASTGVQLFISSVMAFSRDAEDNYLLTVLTQSADYVTLQMEDANAIGAPDGLSVSDIETENSDCLVASSFTCGQIFTVTIPAECPDESATVDLSGNYRFSFTPQCQDDAQSTAQCNVFLDTLSDTAGKVVLDVPASFQDACDVDLFSVTMTGDLTFYSDDALSAEVDGDSDPFVIGQDTIYGKVTVDMPSDETDTTYQFVDVSIENVYVCTAADGVDLSVDANAGTGGCLSSSIDADGPYKVYGDGAVVEYQGTTIDLDASHEAAFSFLTFDTPRTTIAVHVQLLMTLVDESGSRRRVRRRMLLQDDEANQFRSYIGTAAVQEADSSTQSDPTGTDGTVPVAAGLMPAMLVLIGGLMG